MTRWQVFSAVALRRLPELAPRMSPIESKVQEIFDAYEVSKSRLSVHELQHIEDLKSKESTDIDVVIKETAQDKEDRWIKEKSLFEFGKYDGRLTHTHYLFLKQKFGSDINEQWLLPQALYDRNQDDNLLDTARRALRESLNIYTGFRIISKIPSSVYSFKYPKKIVNLTGNEGAKVFFIKANLDTPDDAILEAIDGAKNDKLKWLTKDEAFEAVHKKYMISFSQGLFHEDKVDTDQILRRASGCANAIGSRREQMLQK